MNVKICPMIRSNAVVLRELLPFTRPELMGLHDSIGCGDRLGLANPAHLRGVVESGFKPVLAQQSIRELDRTVREAEDVLDAASWAVIQEGYRGGFGADADHCKTTGDIDRYMRAGFTMITLDIGGYVVNEAGRMPIEEVKRRAQSLPWEELRDSFDSCLARYAGRQFPLSKGFILDPNPEAVVRGLVKYGSGIAQTVALCNHVERAWKSSPHEIELSVDETDSPTTPLEHLIIANELKRLGVKLVGLAPRFVGDFEKGIEYKGDLDLFKSDFLKHQAIAQSYGPYKISIHSGSDKFLIYTAIGSLQEGHIHIKTAGTSYLEALRTIAQIDRPLFRDILECARKHFDKDRQSYHVSASVDRLLPTRSYQDEELPQVLDDDNARQILHVTFGTILSIRDEHGESVYKNRILDALMEHEDAHYANITKHFRKHVNPFLTGGRMRAQSKRKGIEVTL
jgi:hypothetical protein